MHEEQFRVHNAEIDELAKRNSHLHEQSVRFDIECGRLTDELQVALGRVEQLRNESANLRAEKKIWEVRSLYFFQLLKVLMQFRRASKAVSSKKIGRWPWKGPIFLT
jgi:hypothetical protein